MKHGGVAKVKHRLQQALRSDIGSDPVVHPDQMTSLTLLIRALRADLGAENELDIGGDPAILRSVVSFFPRWGVSEKVVDKAGEGLVL